MTKARKTDSATRPSPIRSRWRCSRTGRRVDERLARLRVRARGLDLRAAAMSLGPFDAAARSPFLKAPVYPSFHVDGGTHAARAHRGGRRGDRRGAAALAAPGGLRG